MKNNKNIRRSRELARVARIYNTYVKIRWHREHCPALMFSSTSNKNFSHLKINSFSLLIIFAFRTTHTSLLYFFLLSASCHSEIRASYFSTKNRWYFVQKMMIWHLSSKFIKIEKRKLWGRNRIWINKKWKCQMSKSENKMREKPEIITRNNFFYSGAPIGLKIAQRKEKN